MKIIVTGSTEWVDKETFGQAMTWVSNMKEGIPTVRLVPDRGASALAKRMADHFKWPVEEFQTVQELVGAGGDLVVAFPLPGCMDTWDCLRRANDAGLNIHIVNRGWTYAH